ncbi:MAG TPA: YceI family protein [Rhabdochlamydiaceae bacterium]
MAKWKCDPAHTNVEFIVKHMMITDIHGYLKNIEGMIDFDPENPLKGSIEVKGQASNISTEHQARDEHLHGVDFFDIVNHPTIEFKSSKMELTGTYEGKLFGNLSIRGITHPVVFNTKFNGIAKYKDTRIGFSAWTVIDREDFGVSWNTDMPNGGLVVGREVKILIDLEAVLMT